VPAEFLVTTHLPAAIRALRSAIAIAVVDDLGTVYRRESGEAGGHGTEFRSRWNVLPTAPAAAGWLTLRFTPQAGTPVEVELSLPGTAAV